MVEPDKLYKLLGVRLEGKGPFIREEKLGSQIRAKKLQRVNSGDFIYSRLFAWRGAFGLIPAEMDGSYVSNEFPNFKMNETIVYPKFLELYFRQCWVWNEVEKYCTGTTKASRNRFKEKFFLDLEILLPSLAEQEHLVSKIESLIERIEQSGGLRLKTMEEIEELIEVSYRRVFDNLKSSQQLPLDEITSEMGQHVQASQSPYYDYPYLSLADIQAHTGRILEYRTCQEAGIHGSAVLFETGDVLYSKLRPYLNKVVVPSFKGCATTELVVFRPDTTIVDRKYLATFLRSPQVVNGANTNSIGTKMPRTNMKWFRKIPVPLPTMQEQRRIVAYLDCLREEVNELKNLQKETEREIAELIHSTLNEALKDWSQVESASTRFSEQGIINS